VAKFAPLFNSEQSLIRWVALRGAFSALYIHIFDQSSAVASADELQKAMGLEWATGHSGQPSLELAEPKRSRLSAGQRTSALTVALQVLIAVGDYPRLEALGVSEVNSDARYAGFGDPLALDCIAWSAIALLRLGIGPGPRALIMAPEPDALPAPGWYPEPLWGRAERYWDGSDWTAACRVKGDRGPNQTLMPLR
jgi:Protein of unknown function (DUF2510)